MSNPMVYTCTVLDDLFTVNRKFHRHLAKARNIYDQWLCGECKHRYTQPNPLLGTVAHLQIK